MASWNNFLVMFIALTVVLKLDNNFPKLSSIPLIMTVMTNTHDKMMGKTKTNSKCKAYILMLMKSAKTSLHGKTGFSKITLHKILRKHDLEKLSRLRKDYEWLGRQKYP